MKLKTDNLEESVPCFVTMTNLKKIKLVEPIVAEKHYYSPSTLSGRRAFLGKLSSEEVGPLICMEKTLSIPTPQK